MNVNERFKNALPPLQDAEFDVLKQSILSEGCREPIRVWGDTIVDGHARFAICIENNIPFKTVEMSFDSEEDALLWLIHVQIGRRNLTDFARCELVLPLEKKIKEEAEKRRRAAISASRQGNEKNEKNEKNETVEKLAPLQPKTRDALADMAGVSGRTFDKAKKIVESGDEDLINKVRNGEASIHGAYTALRKRETPLIEGRPSPGYGLVVEPGQIGNPDEDTFCPSMSNADTPKLIAELTEGYIENVNAILYGRDFDSEEIIKVLTHGFESIVEQIKERKERKK